MLNHRNPPKGGKNFSHGSRLTKAGLTNADKEDIHLSMDEFIDDLRCEKCKKLLAKTKISAVKVDGFIEIKCGKCNFLNKFKLTTLDKYKIRDTIPLEPPRSA